MMRFGSFGFDAAPRRLTQQGQPIALTPKAFDLLHFLISEAPRVVAKDEIHAHLWPDYAVSDATLVGLVKEIRRSLGDHDPDARIIRTVHRVGYAFDAPLEADAGPSPACGLLVIGRRRARLVAGDNLVGRDPACDIWIENATVSRRHARILVDEGRITVEDLGSKNGTRIGDMPVLARQNLEDGDHLHFGDVETVFRDSPARQPTATRIDPAD